MLRSSHAPFLALLVVVGCAVGANEQERDDDDSGDESAGGWGGAPSTSGSGGSDVGSLAGPGGAVGIGGETGGSGGAQPVAEVYAHSGTTLFRLDPATLKLSEVGPLNGCGPGSVIDIALDKDGDLWGTKFAALVKINKSTGACSIVAEGKYPTSLSFVPEGTLDPSGEALVGYVGSDYVRIDKTTGAVTKVGTIGQGYESSGDVVSLIDGGTYLTVKGNDCNDCLVEVNPSTGAMTAMIGDLGYPKVFGLAYWGGVAYGFTDGGQLLTIDVETAAATSVPLPNAPANLQFFGSGSTTAAPHTPIPTAK